MDIKGEHILVCSYIFFPAITCGLCDNVFKKNVATRSDNRSICVAITSSRLFCIGDSFLGRCAML